jgi:hypothetical protein
MYDPVYDRKVTNIILLLTLIFFMNDLYLTYPMIQIKHASCITILSFHHFLVFFITLGCFYTDKRKLSIVLAINFFLILFWRTNENRCILTEIVNEYCNLPEDTLFNDFYHVFSLKKEENKPVLTVIQILIVLFILHKLLRN